ncbi:FecR family protein [Aquabacter spiritensis]|uniref:FecR family protein n=1 Tax=Aquabacter spiritensis TaxID=933073 RepID=A0A4R3LVV4_9HYPH|nr:FecR domain-containing protein [Aquabacter spiritensis]TCT04693.1 FecR family protein [Aquabacter spiritensis]
MRGSDPRRFADIALSDQAIDWMVRLHSGTAGESERSGFSTWRETSPAHEIAAREAEALWHGLGRAGGSVRAESKAARGKLTRRTLIVGGAAAALGLGAAVSDPLRRKVLADYSTGVGETRDVVLPDGSRAWLNARTALALSYSAARRGVRLMEGQALFTVVPEPTRPFFVAAANGWTRAIGTAFDVDMRAQSVTVTVVEGVVAVGLEGGSREGVTVRADQAVRYGPQGVAAPQSLDAGLATAWRRGKLIFNRRPLEDVVSELQRHTHTRILIAGPSLRAQEVTGVFDLDDPQSVLDTIEQTLPARVLRLPLLTVIL